MRTPPRYPDSPYEGLRPLFLDLADSSRPPDDRRRAREHLVVRHLPIADHIAARYRNRGQPEQDLRQVARIGLIHAVDRFDPTRGRDFLAFAVPTITGEIRRYFRDATWSVHVPRGLKDRYLAVSAAADELTQRLGRAPRPSELATELDLPIDDVHEALRVAYAYRPEPLDPQPGEQESTTALLAPYVTDGNLGTVEAREALRAALTCLPEREAAIVVLRFFGNMSQSQIARQLGISQMHVSRLLTSSLATLRAVMDPQARPSTG